MVAISLLTEYLALLTTQEYPAMSCRTYHLSVAATTDANAAIHCPHAQEEADEPCAEALVVPTFDCDLYASTCVTPGITPAYADCAATLGHNSVRLGVIIFVC